MSAHVVSQHDVKVRMAVGEKLRKYRRKLRMTLRALDKASGVSFSTISSAEHGWSDLTVARLKKLAPVLGPGFQKELGRFLFGKKMAKHCPCARLYLCRKRRV